MKCLAFEASVCIAAQQWTRKITGATIAERCTETVSIEYNCDKSLWYTLSLFRRRQPEFKRAHSVCVYFTDLAISLLLLLEYYSFGAKPWRILVHSRISSHICHLFACAFVWMCMDQKRPRTHQCNKCLCEPNGKLAG